MNKRKTQNYPSKWPLRKTGDQHNAVIKDSWCLRPVCSDGESTEVTELHSIFYVDSDEETREKLREVAEIKKIHLEVFSHGRSFLKAFQGGPGCLVTELRIQDMSGVELQQRIAEMGSKLPVVFVTAHPETHLIVRALHNGAITVLQKPVSKQEIWDAVSNSLMRDREFRRMDAEREDVKKRLTRLDSKEREVLNLMMKGFPNKVIANRLNVSIRTVEARRHRVFQKTNTKSLVDLIKLVVFAELQISKASE